MNVSEIKRLLAREEAILRIAYARFVRNARSPVVLAQLTRALRAHRTIDALSIIDNHIQEFADQLPRAFVRTASEEMVRIKRLLTHRRLMRLTAKFDKAAWDESKPPRGEHGRFAAFGAKEIMTRELSGAPPPDLQKQDDEATIDIDFDPNDADAVNLMERSRLEFLQDFTAKQRRAIKAALVKAQREGLGTEETARLLRDSIGLTETQWNAVNNYRSMLEDSSAQSLTRQLRDRRFDSTVQNAIDRGDILLDDQIDRMVERYTDRMLDYRARNIARTESHRVMSAARFQAWQQMTDQLGLDGAQVIRTWNTNIDGRERNTHHAMNGQTVSGDDPYVSPSGATLQHPGDPSAPAEEVVNCRCAETYDFGEAA